VSAAQFHQETSDPQSKDTAATKNHEIVAFADGFGITRVVHFTTLSGCLGILASGAVKSRKRLPEDQYLKRVYKPNAKLRKDSAWLDYVNLSIERINDWMFETSQRWHSCENNPWVVLSFHPRTLGHEGVVFTTTNNIYPKCSRGQGLAGFKAMFANQVVGRYGKVHGRIGKHQAWPTDRQAEVLYPKQLSCEHLLRIYVQCEDSAEPIHGILGGLQMNVEVRHSPEVFE